MGIFDRNADAAQRERLDALCQMIDLSFKQFRKAGTALREIRDDQLFRLTHNSFAEFCLDRWNITEPYATRLIAANSICELLGPVGDLVENENQARKLRQLDEPTRACVIEEVTANNSTVADALKKHLPIGRKSQGKLKPIRFKLPGCTLVIEPNKKFQGVEATIAHLLSKLENARDAA